MMPVNVSNPSNFNEQQATNPPPLSLLLKICYGVGHVLNNLCSIIWFTYLLVYIQYVLKLSSSVSGIVLLVGQVTDAVCTPIIGFESDNWPGSCRLLRGRRKSWYLVGTICVAFSFPMMFVGCFGCEHVRLTHLFMLIPMVIIFQFGWAAVQVSHLSLIPALTKVDHERDSLNTIRCSFNDASELLAFVVIYVVFYWHTTVPEDEKRIGPEDGAAFSNVTIITTLIGLIFSTIFFIKIKEKPEERAKGSSETSHQISQKIISYKSWFTNRQFYQVGTIYLLSRLYENLSQVFFPLYLQECKAAPEQMIIMLPMIMNVSGLFILLILGTIIKLVGKKVSYTVSCVVGFIGSAMLCFHNHPNFNGIGEFAMAILIGMAASTMVAISLSLISDLLAENVSSAAFIYGFFSCTEKLGNGISVAIIQYVYQINCQNGCFWYYRSVMVYVLSAIAVFCLLCMLTLIPSTLGKPARHKQELDGKFLGFVEKNESQPLLNKEIKNYNGETC